MEFPDKVQYVTFNKGGLGKPLPVEVENTDPSKSMFRQQIGKNYYDDYMWAAKVDNGYAFTRYLFLSSPIEYWDREIKMYKKNNTLSGKPTKAETEKSFDDFSGLVIFFKRKPDLKKRIKVCHY